MDQGELFGIRPRRLGCLGVGAIMAIKFQIDVLKKYPRNLMNFLPWLELYDTLIRERKYIKWLETKYNENENRANAHSTYEMGNK